MNNLPVLLATMVFPAAVLAWPCPQRADVDGDGRPDTLERSWNHVRIDSGTGELNLPLPGPAVVQACLGDLDGDGRAEVILGVVRATRRDPAYRRRLFVFAHGGGKILQSRFLGSEGSGSLLEFGLDDLDADGRVEVLARERSSGDEVTRVYRWEGYGLVEDAKLAKQAPRPAGPSLSDPSFRELPVVPSMLGPSPAIQERSGGRIRPVRLTRSLAPAVNRRKFRWLPAAARRHLHQHGFVVVRPGESPPEFHSLYIENQYDGLPSFVTADAALHLTHLLFDHALQEIEEDVLAPALTKWVDLLRSQGDLLRPLLPPGLTGALDSVLVKLDIAAVLLGEDPAFLDAGRRSRVLAEIEGIEKAVAGSSGLGLDYGDFVVRGHYASREALARYFRAFLFLSSVPIRDPAEVDLWTALIASGEGIELMAWLEAFGDALVGPAANTSATDLVRRARSVVGERPSWTELLDRIRAGGTTGKEGVFCRTQADEPGVCRVSILARRWPADNDVLAATTEPESRPFPDPLDLLAVLGSARARDLLEAQVKKWPGLQARIEKASRAYRDGIGLQNRSLGGRWLHALRWLLLAYPKGYASFQLSTAWQNRVLVAAAASWAELRRDTILYVQPPVVWAEGGDEESIPPSRAGFVEPVPELYAELADLLQAFRHALVAFGGEGMMRGGEYFRKSGPARVLQDGEELLRFLKEAASRELAGKGLTRDEHERLSSVGSWFEHVLAGRGKLRMEPVPVVADVYYFADPETRAKSPLLIATGPVDVIVVAVPLGKRVILARGAVLSFYHWIGSGPISDQTWRDRLEENRAPPQPAWARPAATMKKRRSPRSRK